MLLQGLLLVPCLLLHHPLHVSWELAKSSAHRIPALPWCWLVPLISPAISTSCIITALPSSPSYSLKYCVVCFHRRGWKTTFPYEKSIIFELSYFLFWRENSQYFIEGDGYEETWLLALSRILKTSAMLQPLPLVPADYSSSGPSDFTLNKVGSTVPQT